MHTFDQTISPACTEKKREPLPWLKKYKEDS